ncbi:hypothetical protein WJX73_009923 [Symbiochloris irregularis]|uniref:Uncharacterized protein n=1 Tax=Symbiochloris irregularis TaxID=706552 RepID=A0AAW1P187_9CHLO
MLRSSFSRAAVRPSVTVKAAGGQQTGKSRQKEQWQSLQINVLATVTPLAGVWYVQNILPQHSIQQPPRYADVVTSVLLFIAADHLRSSVLAAKALWQAKQDN